MTATRAYVTAFGAAAGAALVLTVLPMLSGFTFDPWRAPYIVAGCFLAGAITGARAHFARGSWSVQRVAVTCFCTVGWMAVAIVCVLLYQARR